MANGKISGSSGPSQLPEKNIQGLLLPLLPQPEQPDEVQELYRVVVDKGREAMGWYSRNMAVRKKWGQRLRMWAIFLTSLASITPILVQLLPDGQERWGLLASVFAVLGATCVGLDNYFGASSGWMRYVSAYQEINSKLEALQFGWARLALMAPTTPKEQRLTMVMDLLQAFIVDVNATVKQETQDWMAEFKGHLAVLEQRMDAQRTALSGAPSAAYGAIKVQVEGSDNFRDSKWRVVLGTGKEIDGIGSSTGVATTLGPGLLSLRLEALLKDGRPLVTEDVTTIKAGEVTLHVFQVH